MSNFFRSAAMTLLSKTLQTLLGKYLEDVDVEGVALPSLYSSDDSLGWGVRLSNVKLREGAKLMDLPGKPKSKKQEQKRKRGPRSRRTNKKVPTKEDKRPGVDYHALKTPKRNNRMDILKETTNDSEYMVTFEAGPIGMQLEPAGPSGCRVQRFVDDGPHNPGPARQSGKIRLGDKVISVATASINGEVLSSTCTYEAIVRALQENDAVKRVITFRSVWGKPIPERSLSPAKSAESTDYADDIKAQTKAALENEELAYYDEEVTMESGNSSSRWLSWRCRSSASKPKPKPRLDSSANDIGLPEKVTEATDKESETSSSSDMGQDETINRDDLAKSPEEDYSLEPQDQQDGNVSGLGQEKIPENQPTAPLLEEETVKHQHQSEGADKKEESNDDEFIEYEDDEFEEDDEDDDFLDDDEDDEPPMVLRLGEGGRIRTLDVRLVGKEIHVLVEDASLTIECVRLSAPARSEGTEPVEEDPTAAITGEQKKNQKQSFDPNTVGGRVMAENKIARAFSTIPNLFLRDICVRLVIVDEMTTPGNINNEVEIKSPNEEQRTATEAEYGNEAPVLEFVIEFFSVTDGEDFMMNFEASDQEESDGGDGGRNVEEEQYLSASENGDDESDFDADIEHDFLVKRIRTGRGPEGGISLRLLPQGKTALPVEIAGDDDSSNSACWANSVWMSSTEFCMLRVSGLDLLARIYLGTNKDEVSVANNAWYGSSGAGDHGESADGMLFGGVDYIAPGPEHPSLPPIPSNTREIIHLEQENNIFWAKEPTMYQADKNGIHYCFSGSSFHRVARGLTPSVSGKDHLPCEDCPDSWETDAIGVAREHPLDAATPMAGLVLSVSMRDPLEINIDRQSLEVIGLVLSLFTAKKQSEKIDVPANDAIDSLSQSPKENAFPNGTSDHSINTASPLNFNSANAYSNSEFHEQSGAELAETADGLARRRNNSSGERDDLGQEGTTGSSLSQQQMQNQENNINIESSFPTYMQPEKIQILGVHLSKVTFRIHIMRSSKEEVDDSGLAFCYWEIRAKCVTMDHHRLSAHETSFQDLRFDVGHLTVKEYRGIESKQRASAGVRQRVIDLDDEQTVATLVTAAELNNKRGPWPNTAAVLLDLPPPLETLVYEKREGHALQFRFIGTDSLQSHENRSFSRQHAFARVGAFAVDAPFKIKDQVLTVISEAKNCVFGSSEHRQKSLDRSPRPSVKMEATMDSLMKYKLQIDGGRICLDPLIDVRIPLTTVGGERSSSSGLSFETILENVNLKYGQGSPALALKRELSLRYLAELPESARLRVLLFLEDLTPLESALGLKSESNPFRRCSSVNKGILKSAKKLARSSKMVHGKDLKKHNMNRRQQLLNQLLKMDDDALESLWATHQLSKRRLSRVKRNSKRL